MNIINFPLNIKIKENTRLKLIKRILKRFQKIVKVLTSGAVNR